MGRSSEDMANWMTQHWIPVNRDPKVGTHTRGNCVPSSRRFALICVECEPVCVRAETGATGGGADENVSTLRATSDPCARDALQPAQKLIDHAI